MTPERIAELKRMLAEATPGYVALGTAVIRGTDLSIGLDRAPEGVEANEFLPMESFGVIGGRRARQDAELIVALVNAAPDLIDEVERARTVIDVGIADRMKLAAALDAKNAEVERLQRVEAAAREASATVRAYFAHHGKILLTVESRAAFEANHDAGVAMNKLESALAEGRTP